ncbi:MAG: aldolase [Phycisphaerales bacterium]|nr:aldolase [Phycisphaerales bacterium]
MSSSPQSPYAASPGSAAGQSNQPVLLRPSRVLQKMRAGQTAGCVKLNLADARVAEIAALTGIDCIWADLEHVPNTLHDIENQVRAAKMHNTDTIVRVPRGSYSDLIYPLEMDAAGIMVPHVKTAAEARWIAQQTKFQPVGRRALDGGNADGAYCGADMSDYIRHANEQRFVIVQIEDPEAMDELDEIAAVPGVDMIFFGPGDFSHGLGIAGQINDPRVVAARKAVVQAALKHGKFAGTVGGLGNRQELIDMGFRFLSIGADVVAIYEYFANIAKAFK